MQNGTLAGNIATKKKYPDFPSDVFLTFETLDAQVVVNVSAKEQRSMALSDFLRDSTPNMVIAAFELKAYPKEKYIFRSYKVSYE